MFSVWTSLKSLLRKGLKEEQLTLYQIIPTFKYLHKKGIFECIVEKGENADNHHFLPFPQYFLPVHNKFHFFINVYFAVCICIPIWTSLNFFLYCRDMTATENIVTSSCLFSVNAFKSSEISSAIALILTKSFTILSLIHHFETVRNSKKLQTTTEMWLSKDF